MYWRSFTFLYKQMKYICFINILNILNLNLACHMLALCLIKWSTLYLNPVLLLLEKINMRFTLNIHTPQLLTILVLIWTGPFQIQCIFPKSDTIYIKKKEKINNIYIKNKRKKKNTNILVKYNTIFFIFYFFFYILWSKGSNSNWECVLTAARETTVTVLLVDT